jgi:hypothetical protein
VSEALAVEESHSKGDHVNCCNEYGQCEQGRDCPVRTGVVLPHQVAHKNLIEEMGPEPMTWYEAVGIYGGFMVISFGIFSMFFAAIS